MWRRWLVGAAGGRPDVHADRGVKMPNEFKAEVNQLEGILAEIEDNNDYYQLESHSPVRNVSIRTSRNNNSS